jgi:hypothetical protein
MITTHFSFLCHGRTSNLHSLTYFHTGLYELKLYRACEANEPLVFFQLRQFSVHDVKVVVQVLLQVDDTHTRCQVNSCH